MLPVLAPHVCSFTSAIAASSKRAFTNDTEDDVCNMHSMRPPACWAPAHTEYVAGRARGGRAAFTYYSSWPALGGSREQVQVQYGLPVRRILVLVVYVR